MRALTFLFVVLLASDALSQSGPTCLIPDQGGSDFRYLWGGEIRQVFALSSGNQTRIWTAEDGGRIRFSKDGGANWFFQDVPDTVSQTLIDVWFHSDGATGWACGRGGRLLGTSDGGASWDFVDPAQPVLFDGKGDPAVLWRARFLAGDTSRGWVAGLYTFRTTSDGGLSWNDVQLFEDASFAVQLDPTDFEFYGLDLVGDASHFAGHASAEWKNPPGGGDTGVCFHTDSADPLSQGGTRWWITFRNDAFAGASLVEPWDVEFDASAPDPSLAEGVLVGGTGVGDGEIAYSADGGLSWTIENVTLPPGEEYTTLYGAAWLGAGNAIAAGYGGQLWRRDPSTRVWELVSVPGFTGPLACASGFGGDTCWVGGAFGFFRRTLDYGTTWEFQNPPYDAQNPECEWRLEDLYFSTSPPGTGFVVGQFELIARTLDGGCTWQILVGGPDSGLGGKLEAIDFSGNEQSGVAVGVHAPQGGTPAYFTSDGGATWTPAAFNFPLPSNVDLHDVAWIGGSEFMAVGTQGPSSAQLPYVLHSADMGQTWDEVGPPPGNGLVLVSVDFPTPVRGFAVGWDGNLAKAFRAQRVLGSWVWFDVSPTPPPDPAAEPRQLLAVRGRPTSQSLAGEAWAAGGPGILLRYDATADVFGGVPGVYELFADGSIKTQLLSQDLSAIGLSPVAAGPPTVLVGAQGSSDPALSLDLGLALRNAGAGWELLPANTNKSVRAIHMVSAGRAWAVCRPDQEDQGADIASVNDSTLLHYQANAASVGGTP